MTSKYLAAVERAQGLWPYEGSGLMVPHPRHRAWPARTRPPHRRDRSAPRGGRARLTVPFAMALLAAVAVVAWHLVAARQGRSRAPVSSPPCPLLSVQLYARRHLGSSPVVAILKEGRLSNVRAIGGVRGHDWVPGTRTLAVVSDDGMALVSVPAVGQIAVSPLPATAGACRRPAGWGGEADSLAVSPDARLAAFTCGGHLFVTDLSRPLVGPREIQASSATHPYPSASEPTWSCDGRSLLVLDTTDRQLVVYDVTTGGRQALSSTAGSPSAHGWSSTSRRIAYLWSPPPRVGADHLVSATRTEVRVLDVATRASRTAASLRSLGLSLSWRPRHEELIFDDGGQLWSVGADGAQLRRVSGRKGGVTEWNPAWSADGEWLAYVLTQSSGDAVVVRRMADRREWLVRCGDYTCGGLSWERQR